jgi:hypothetical protein
MATSAGSDGFADSAGVVESRPLAGTDPVNQRQRPTEIVGLTDPDSAPRPTDRAAAEPDAAESDRTDPGRTNPGRTDPGRTEPDRTDPGGAAGSEGEHGGERAEDDDLAKLDGFAAFARGDAATAEPPRRRPRIENWPRLATHLAWVLVIYLFTRLIQLMILMWLAGPDTSVKSRLLAWDGGWWIRVATEGYPQGFTYDAQGKMSGNSLAFFPFYPSLIKLLDGTGLDAGSSALIIAWVAAAVACVLLYQLGTVLSGGRARVGFILVVLFCTQPMSIVLSMGYSEALFIALVAGVLLACWYERWMVAGVVSCAAGLTRPTGAAVALALLVAVIVAMVQHRARWTALIGAAIGLAGVPAYLLWVGLRVGHLDAWFQIQTAGWGTTTDYGKSSFEFVKDTLHQGDGFVQVSVALLLIAAVVATIIAVTRRTWLPLTVYGVITVAMVVGQAGYYHSKPRLLIPALLTLVPAAFVAARARTSTAVLALTAYGLYGMWFGAYMLTVWHYTI